MMMFFFMIHSLAVWFMCAHVCIVLQSIHPIKSMGSVPQRSCDVSNGIGQPKQNINHVEMCEHPTSHTWQKSEFSRKIQKDKDSGLAKSRHKIQIGNVAPHLCCNFEKQDVS